MQRQNPDQSERVFDILVSRSNLEHVLRRFLGSLELLGRFSGSLWGIGKVFDSKVETRKVEHLPQELPRGSSGDP